MNALFKSAIGIVLLVAVLCLVGGVSMIVQRETGTRVQALVTDCVNHGRYGTDCNGTWTEGGDLVGGGGHVVVGPVQGAVSTDIGKTLDVTVSGGSAYSRSLVLPIMLIILGLPLTALTGIALFGRSRRRAATP